jgi:hypothetical protein
MNAPALALQDVGGDLTRPTLTLTQAARSFLRWLEAHGYAKNTLLSYGFGLSEFLRYAAGVPLTGPSEVTILALDGYFVWLQVNGASARTAAHRRTVLIELWRWLEHEGRWPASRRRTRQRRCCSCRSARGGARSAGTARGCWSARSTRSSETGRAPSST